MKNKIHLELRKAELEWLMTFPDCPWDDRLQIEQEIREIKDAIGQLPFSPYSKGFLTEPKNYIKLKGGI